MASEDSGSDVTEVLADQASDLEGITACTTTDLIIMVWAIVTTASAHTTASTHTIIATTVVVLV